MFFDFGINFVLSIIDIITVISIFCHCLREMMRERMRRFRIIRNVSCLLSFLWMIYGSELFLAHSNNMECRDYLLDSSVAMETPFSPELYIEDQMHGINRAPTTHLSKLFVPAYHAPMHKTGTRLPTWLTPFGISSGWCSASVLRTVVQINSAGACQQLCVNTTGCRAVGFQDYTGECKLFASKEVIKGTLDQSGDKDVTCYVRGICVMLKSGKVHCRATSPEQHADAREVISAVVSAKPRTIDALTNADGSDLPILSAENFTFIEEMKKRKPITLSCNCKTIHNFGWYLVIYRWILEGLSVAATFGMVPVVMGACRRCMRNYDFSS